MRTQKGWTDDEDEFLRTNHHIKSHQLMANELGRTRDSVKNRCVILKIKYDKEVSRNVRMNWKKTGNGPGAIKLQKIHQDMQNILAYITTMGEAKRDELCQKLKISYKVVSNRLKKLQRDGLDGVYIQTIPSGRNGAVWRLGKQDKIKIFNKPRMPRSKAEPINTSFKLDEMPPALQRLFGLIPNFEPAKGEPIPERMPSWANRNAGTSIGNGSYAYLNALGEM